MKKIFFIITITAAFMTACGDPSAEQDYDKTNSTSTTGNPSGQEYDQATDPLHDSINRANQGTINNDPNGVNVEPKKEK
jgi:hypothetical protein